MKNEVILKINKMGKAGEIVAKIIKALLIITLVACIVASGLLCLIPRDAVSITTSHHALANFNLDFDYIIAMDEDMITFEFDDIEYNNVQTHVDGDRLSATMSSDPRTIYLKDGLWILIAAAVFVLTCIIAVQLVEKLCKMFRTCETPFTEEISVLLKKVATALIPVAVLSTLVENSIDGFMAGQVSVVIGVDLLPVLLAVMIFMLSEIFRYGAALQQESDETL